ncbi:hypothetical protein DPMN_115660 [Dreissena polymorpha]|uniref:Uncharacterized protein n=1 Tax=Dreissena polymorpha TaxID=45954 RepID=A0A9D4KLL2_DREPO|nr:hypothetical protein DPMN_115660 [Dreissena polymorpha]
MSEEDALKFPPTTSIDLISDATKSSMELIAASGETKVGDMIRVCITMYDHTGHRKTTGGDILKLYMCNQSQWSTRRGTVVDHNNGTYTGEVEAAWSGQSELVARLEYTREAISAIDIIRTPKQPCFHPERQKSWNLRKSSGFVYHNKWSSSVCNLLLLEQINQVIANKSIYFIGDSNARAIYRYAVFALNCTDAADEAPIKNLAWHRPTKCSNSAWNFTAKCTPGMRILRLRMALHLQRTTNATRESAIRKRSIRIPGVKWFPHAQPFITSIVPDTKAYTTVSVARRLDNIKDDEDAVYILQDRRNVLTRKKQQGETHRLKHRTNEEMSNIPHRNDKT